jgi:cell division protein FtsI (penicillin-binding protein 3)
LETQDLAIKTNYEYYFDTAQKYKTIMPDLTGLPAMDAITLLENMGMKVKLVGNGKVKNQSIVKGTKLNSKQTIVLELS